jgi:hypothetical protein
MPGSTGWPGDWLSYAAKGEDILEGASVDKASEVPSGYPTDNECFCSAGSVMAVGQITAIPLKD